MQLKSYITIALVISSTYVFAQKIPKPQYSPRPQADIILNYYEQDGNNSAVTGGEGTERLIDRSSKIAIYVPVDSLGRLDIDVAFNYYSSASTDKIDSEISSASHRDGRGRFRVRYERKTTDLRWTYSILGGSSVESDYMSFYAGAGLSHKVNRSSTLHLSSTLFLDRWIIYPPEEFRSMINAVYQTDVRNTSDNEIAWQSDINKKTRVAIILNPVYQFGLLSTPFHRVFLNDNSVQIEKLPDEKLKIAAAFRVNHFATRKLILRGMYRYYNDSWGSDAHTIEFENIYRVKDQLSIFPFVRYHQQSAAKYFAERAEHLVTANYYTSDFDLSKLSSIAFGAGVRFEEQEGILNFQDKNRTSVFDKVELRYSYYDRSDGLSAWMLGVILGYRF